MAITAHMGGDGEEDHMTDVQRIEPGNPDYPALMNNYKSQEAKRVRWRNSDWLAVRENEAIVFVRVGSASDISTLYDSSSIPPHG